MLAALPDSTTIVFILLGSLSAGFVTGFAGFGTGLVASGFWFHVLPPGFVPPMVVFASVAGQLVSLVGLRPRFDWPRALPYLVGGTLGEYPGLSGPLPLIWLQLRGGPSLEQRAVYQPFNLIVLALAAAGMAGAGRVDTAVLSALLIAVPGTVIGAFLGARLYRHASEATFRKVVLTLLLASGALLVLEGLW